MEKPEQEIAAKIFLPGVVNVIPVELRDRQPVRRLEKLQRGGLESGKTRIALGVGRDNRLAAFHHLISHGTAEGKGAAVRTAIGDKRGGIADFFQQIERLFGDVEIHAEARLRGDRQIAR